MRLREWLQRHEQTREKLVETLQQQTTTLSLDPMTSSSSSMLHISILIFYIIIVISDRGSSLACYTRIFGFGDSLTDTGNYLQSLDGRPDPVRSLPYGQTFFGHATGRFCNGRLIVDFLAQALGLPFLPPYLAGRTAEDFPHGANFAVAGATAMNGSFFGANGVTVTWTEYSLGTQLQWFKKLLPLISSDSDRSKIMNSSLFLVGEIGGNDYNHPLFQGKTIEEVRTFVPSVINTIGSAINDLIELGARTLVVPGNFPMGCVPTYLIEFQSQKEEDYDPQTGCIKQLNEFAEYHNRQLLNELDRLRRLHPHATIIYADYYGPSMSVYHLPQQYGIKAPLNACCGSDAPYNYTPSVYCGSPESIVCADPSKYVSWDGLHLTEEAYKIVSHAMLQGPNALPALKACANNQTTNNQTSAARVLYPRHVQWITWTIVLSTLL